MQLFSYISGRLHHVLKARYSPGLSSQKLETVHILAVGSRYMLILIFYLMI